MGSSEGGSPVKLMPPGTDSSQKRWNFAMYDSKKKQGYSATIYDAKQ